MEGGKSIQQQAESEDRQASLYRVQDQRSSGIFTSQPRSEGKHERDADNEEEEGKDQVGWGPTVPLRMCKRPIGSTVCGVIDQDHGRDGGAAKDIQRDQPRRRFWRLRDLNRDLEISCSHTLGLIGS